MGSVAVKTLIDVLSTARKPPRVYRQPDGSAVVLLPHGGRVLGLFSPHCDENFYWTHPALQGVDSAAALFAGEQWHNTGGDRTWLAPEIDFFLPNFPKTDVYFQPRGLDPGNYRLEEDADGDRWVNRLECVLSRGGATVALEIAKSIGPAPNPLRYQRPAPPDAVEYAGYTQATRLAILGDNARAAGPVGLWNLVQMPHGGEMIIPTYSRSVPRIIFGSIAEEDLAVDDRGIRYRMRAAGEHKIGVRACAVAGRIGYRYHAADGRSALIVRNFFVNPSGEYIDAPWTDPTDLGYAVQACNVHSGLGSFSELEYHVPAAGRTTGTAGAVDVSQVWAFRGPPDDVDRIAEQLLGAK
jgi:hypothetical protein